MIGQRASYLLSAGFLLPNEKPRRWHDSNTVNLAKLNPCWAANDPVRYRLKLAPEIQMIFRNGLILPPSGTSQNHDQS